MKVKRFAIAAFGFISQRKSVHDPSVHDQVVVSSQRTRQQSRRCCLSAFQPEWRRSFRTLTRKLMLLSMLTKFTMLEYSEIDSLIPKTIGNRKRDCAWGCAWGINTTWENLQIEKRKSVRWAERTPSWFVLFDLQIFSGGVYPQAQPHAQSLFLFPIVFGINLIHFFDFSTRKKNGATGNSIVCFPASIPCQSCHLTVRRMRTVSKSGTFLATESVNSAPFRRGETEVQIFWQGKVQNSSPILRCTFLARRSAKLIANFSATMVTSLPSFSLSLSLSLYLSLSLTECTSRTI